MNGAVVGDSANNGGKNKKAILLPGWLFTIC